MKIECDTLVGTTTDLID